MASRETSTCVVFLNVELTSYIVRKTVPPPDSVLPTQSINFAGLIKYRPHTPDKVWNIAMALPSSAHKSSRCYQKPLLFPLLKNVQPYKYKMKYKIRIVVALKYFLKWLFYFCRALSDSFWVQVIRQHKMITVNVRVNKNYSLKCFKCSLS